jgi:Flp pilus assembly pilin Flp
MVLTMRAPQRAGDDDGQTMAEAALIMALVSIVAAAGLLLVAPNVLALWQRAVDNWP